MEKRVAEIGKDIEGWKLQVMLEEAIYVVAREVLICSFAIGHGLLMNIANCFQLGMIKSNTT